jgi:hypothetical protein
MIALRRICSAEMKLAENFWPGAADPVDAFIYGLFDKVSWLCDMDHFGWKRSQFDVCSQFDGFELDPSTHRRQILQNIGVSFQRSRHSGREIAILAAKAVLWVSVPDSK